MIFWYKPIVIMGIALLLFLVASAPLLATTDRSVTEMLNGDSKEIEWESFENEQKELNDEEAAVVSGGNDRGIFGLLLQLGLALVAVLAIMYFLLSFLGRKTSRFQSSGAMQNLGGLGVGSQKSVQLIRVGDRLLVIGVGNSLQLLREIEDTAEVEELIEMSEQQARPDFTWKGLPFIKRGKSEGGNPDDFHMKLKAELAEIQQGKRQSSNVWKGEKNGRGDSRY